MIQIGVTGLRGLPNVMGGIEAHAQELYPRLNALRSDVSIHITTRPTYVDSSIRSFKGVSLWPVPTVANKYFETIIHTLLSILFLRIKCGCRIIHIHAIGPGLLTPLARLLGMRVILTHHGQDYKRAKWSRFAKVALRAAEAIGVYFANEVIVVSNAAAKQLRRQIPGRARSIHFIPNGASPTFSEGEPDLAVLDQFGITRGRYVLAVGRLVPEKGFDDLIKATKHAGGDRKLVIAGAADHMDAYARSLLCHASDRVIFTGFQTHEVLRSLYAGASLFVLPSHHEGLPIAGLEAASVGIPVLLSDIGANLEIGLPARNYYPVGDVDALTRCLAKPAKIYAVDSAAVKKNFDWNKIAVRTQVVFSKLDTDRPGRLKADSKVSER